MLIMFWDINQEIDLRVIPADKIARDSYLSILSKLRIHDPAAHWVTSYKSFTELNDKSANLTVRQLWARMVNSVHGMSHEKANSIVKHWDSPRAFWESYKYFKITQPSQTDKPWSWIQEADASQFRKIGNSLAKKLWDLFDQTEYDSQLSVEDDSSW